MKLDSKAMRHLTSDDWRVLQACEQGSKNHEIIPTPLIEKLARLRGGAGSTRKSISALAKVGLIGRVKEAKYDGYRLTYGGLDYLALHHYADKKHIYSVGTRVGVGKESDIMIVADDKGTQKILKIHRLGRISFRTVKSNRDYLKKKQGGSWMYLSRLAAEKEFAFMRALKDEGFLVPEPISQSRHTILMDLIDAHPMRQISQVGDPAALYAELIAVILRLAKHGLIHGDFNEFNILLKEEVVESPKPTDMAPIPTTTEPTNDKPDGQEPETPALSDAAQPSSSSSSSPPKTQEPQLTVTPIIIDFPQMVSMDHVNAEMYFDRDVACIKRFFERRFHFVPTEPGPFFKDAKKTVGQDGATRLDAAVAASGFTKKMLKDLEAAIREQQESRGEQGEDGEDGSDDEDDGEYDEESGSGQEDGESDNGVHADDAEGEIESDISHKGMEKLSLAGM